MFRAAVAKLLPRAAIHGVRRDEAQLLPSSSLRFYCANHAPNVSPVALQMINYAVGLARSQKTDESCGAALLILEQGLCSQSHDETDSTKESSKGMILLAISSLLSERGNTDEAIQTLLRIQDLTNSSMGVRVAAIEALVGLHLELGLDDTSSVLVDNCLNLLEKEGPEMVDDYGYKVFSARSKAIKGLVELVRGDIESGNAALSYGEFLHAKREFDAARDIYQKAIAESSEKKGFSDPYAVAACNMSSEEVLLGSTCALGQLESHLGNFAAAEDILTRALKKAEEYFGTYHPKVGIVLTCIALMYRQKATAERSSSLLLQEEGSAGRFSNASAKDRVYEPGSRPQFSPILLLFGLTC
ncbi:hypothetical protein Cgig2_030952 [Carnegiea gigantea]|uniref:Uncharacterized protein n=1 Tax=Carnegiea gigantea TaxID=171969 RepID=A0A9Q1JIV3_9CARY|nr:hypothetical protein Cgig2_030952 [Carnegiea gigantea]